MKVLLADIKEWKQGWLKYFVYSYKLTVWLYTGRIRRLFSFLEKHSGLIRRSSFILAGLVIGLAVNHFSGVGFTQDILSNYFIALGAMIGGTIAIVFTISIFLIQSSAELYSSQYFEVFIHDWKEKFVYFVVIVIALMFFGAGLYTGGLTAISYNVSTYSVLLSLMFVGTVFALIDWQYKNVRQKLNPAQAIVFLENEGIRFLNKLQIDAERLADLLHARNPETTTDMALAQAYNHFLQSFINNLDRQLENLIEISTKLSDKQEVATTKRGLWAVHNILIRFFEARKTSSLAIPSGIAFLAVESDSQNFLNRNFERLNKIGEKFMKEEKDVLASYVVDIYGALAAKAKDMRFVSNRNENPILEQVVGNLDFFIQSAERVKNIEVVFQGTRVLTNVAIIMADQGSTSSLKGIQDKILRIAIFGITQKQGVIIDRCNTSFLTIIGATFGSNKIIRKFCFDDSLKHIATIANYISNFTKAGLFPKDIMASFTLSKAYDEMYMMIVNIVNYYPNITEQREKDTYRSDFINFVEDLTSSLRTLSEQLKSCDTTLTDSISRLTFNVNNLLIDFINDPEFVAEKEELKKRLSWNIYLLGWFAHHTDKFDAGSNPFNTLTDCIAKTGILITEKLEDKKLVSSCVGSLYSLTTESLTKGTSTYGYDEPRVLEKACYLGILALKKGWLDVFADVKAKILEFEPKYFAKYLMNLPEGIDPENHNVVDLPHKDQLTRELLRWRNDYERESRNGLLRIRDDAEAMMYEVVEQYDIDKFMFEVWAFYIPEGRFGREMDARLAQEQSQTTN